MTARAYYNEFDPAAAAVLRQLIDDCVIAPGEVDTRSIKEVKPDDLLGFTQCHFFAGGGLWSVAARLAGWPDDRELWTGSCPCQPFSAAGKGLGTDDPRHLWPDFHRLIRARRPAVVMGEQVAGAAGYGWFDGVRADLAGEGYAGRAVDFPACAVDAPHQRNRLYWIAERVGLADANQGGRGRRAPDAEWSASERTAAERHDQGERRSVDQVDAASIGWREGRAEPVVLRRRSAAAISDAPSVVLDDALLEREQRTGGTIRAGRDSADDATGEGVALGDGARVGRQVSPSGRQPAVEGAIGADDPHRVTQGDAQREGLEGLAGHGDNGRRQEQDRPTAASDGAGTAGVGLADGDEPVVQGQPSAGQLALHEQDARTRGRNGTHWSDAEWLICHDGKARRAKPGLRLLVDGLPGRVDLWRVGGNAIVPQAAAEVIAAYLDCERAAA